jgi:hypoxanthine phosphoribosyltransferase
MAEHEALTWLDFGAAADDLARTVVADGFAPQVVLGVARGGLFLAGALSYALGVKNVHVVNIEYYTGIDERLEQPVVLAPAPSGDDLAGLRVLIVDDVADTGATLQVVHDLYAGHVADARYAVIYEKPRSEVRCQYVWRRTQRWIDFPWSSSPALLPEPRPTPS